MGFIRVRAAALVRRGDEVLLIEHAKNGRSYWLLPGGGVEFGETIESALQREMREETNLDVAVKELAFSSETIDPKGERHILHLVFWADILGGNMCVGEEDRLKSLTFVPVSELTELDMHPPIAEQLKQILQEEVPRARHLGALWCE